MEHLHQFDKGGFFKGAKGVIHKVPATASEALKSNLMGMFEKNRCGNLFRCIQDYEKDKPQTQKGFGPDVPFKDIIKKFNLKSNTVDFVGHAVALYINDDFLEQKALPTIDKMQLYFNSLGRYGNSPFIYPFWGLSGFAEGFSRLCALYGGTYILIEMLKKYYMMKMEISEELNHKEKKPLVKY